MQKIPWMWPGGSPGENFMSSAAKRRRQINDRVRSAGPITCGGKWPDGTPAPLGDMLIWSGEDDIEDTILPRFVAAGGTGPGYFIDEIIVEGAKRASIPQRI